ncbi:hypothetical protein [Streptomyces swartbergensis]|uniref:hypothetical protein n=1 Tax=Streptomyces swartbergensis TaxID=487165 RepID=UPI0037F3B1A0
MANTGKAVARNVQVRFYWANPAGQVLFSTANLIGAANADIPAGESQEVLCLVPWQVVVVNNGHECLIAAADLPGDPPLPDAAFPPDCAQVAQLNLTVLHAMEQVGRSHLTMIVVAAPRQAKAVRISSRIGCELTQELLRRYGLQNAHPVETPAVQVTSSPRPDCDPHSHPGESYLDLEVPPGQSRPVYVTVSGSRLERGQYQLIHIEESQDDTVMCGLSILVTSQAGKG